jgi:hypothetical protein
MLRILVSVCLFAALASTFLSAIVLPAPPLGQETLPLATWLGALSMIAGALSHNGPHRGR